MQKYTITITLQEGEPELKINCDASKVKTGEFALMANTFKKLTLAAIETHLQVSSDLSITAKKASEAGAFDDE